MPDLPNRRKREAQISRGLGRIFRSTRRSVSRGRRIVWGDLQSQIAKLLELLLAQTFRDSFKQSRAEVLTTATDLVDTMGADWALKRSTELANGLVSNIQAELAAGRDPDKVFSVGRAEIVAATETTAAISHGELAARAQDAQDQLASGEPPPPDEQDPTDSGLGIVDGKRAMWITEKDERVCPICEPLHLTPEDDWADQFPFGPPAHPNCRCHLELIPQGWSWRDWARRRRIS